MKIKKFKYLLLSLLLTSCSSNQECVCNSKNSTHCNIIDNWSAGLPSDFAILNDYLYDYDLYIPDAQDGGHSLDEDLIIKSRFRFLTSLDYSGKYYCSFQFLFTNDKDSKKQGVPFYVHKLDETFFRRYYYNAYYYNYYYQFVDDDFNKDYFKMDLTIPNKTLFDNYYSTEENEYIIIKAVVNAAEDGYVYTDGVKNETLDITDYATSTFKLVVNEYKYIFNKNARLDGSSYN